LITFSNFVLIYVFETSGEENTFAYGFCSIVPLSEVITTPRITQSSLYQTFGTFYES